MPQQAWSDKRDREYEHVKEGLEDRGRSETTAKRIASATVNKDRARAGESKTASSNSLKDMSSSKRGGEHSHSGPAGRTKQQLYDEAKRENIPGRSKMTKAELEKHIKR
jgi:hypothetical protein